MGGFVATIIRVTDGDTIVTEVDLMPLLGIDGELRHKVRFVGVNAPEKNTQAGKDARAFLTELATNKECLVQITNIDKYGGRHDGNVWLAGDSKTLAQHILDAGLGVPYSGGKR